MDDCITTRASERNMSHVVKGRLAKTRESNYPMSSNYKASSNPSSFHRRVAYSEEVGNVF